MLYQLSYPANAGTRSLFAPLLQHNLAIASILDGHTPATIFTDDPVHPNAAFTWFHYRAFLAGHPEKSNFSTELSYLLRNQLIPEARRTGINACVLDFAEPDWECELPKLFSGLEPIKAQRQYYSCLVIPKIVAPVIPDGFILQPVDATLLNRMDLQRINELREETCSERVSVEDFLAHSFGYCIIHKDELVCWCLSEYNTNGMCEVGVATSESYQQRGLATIATLSLLEHAFDLGYSKVGWHCWSRNLPSAALAQKAGFTLEQDHIVYLYTSLTT
jgi:GNAT superfamily N-acetyltransferase